MQAVLKGMGLLAGVSDMTFLREDGRTVFIELKLPGQKQSKKQRDWERVVTACNAYYFVIETETEFQTTIKEHATIGIKPADNISTTRL